MNRDDAAVSVSSLSRRAFVARAGAALAAGTLGARSALAAAERASADEITVAHRFVDRWGATLRIPIPRAARWPHEARESRPRPVPTPSTSGAHR